MDTEDGIKDILVSIASFLRDIDSLGLPDIIKKALKTLKSILIFCSIKKPRPELK